MSKPERSCHPAAEQGPTNEQVNRGGNYEN